MGKRNFHRAKRFRENSIEQPRNHSETEHSTSAPNIMESTACFDDPSENSMSHDKILPSAEEMCEEAFPDATNQQQCVKEQPSDLDPCDALPACLYGTFRQNVEPIPSSKPKNSPKLKKSDRKPRPSDKAKSAKEPCDDINCFYGPSPESIDASVIGIDNNIKRCPYCEVPVCRVCRKYRGRHKEHFRNPP